MSLFSGSNNRAKYMAKPTGVMPLLFSLLMLTPSASIADTIHGVFKVVKGNVKVIGASDKKETKAKIGLKVFPLDTIIAGKDSRAKIIMVDNNEINISPDTQIQIQNYEFKPAEDKKNVLIQIMYGKIRAKVNQKYEGTNTFQVRTPTAVAGVRGTDFITSYDKPTNTSNVVTFRGRVAFGLPGAGREILSPVFVSAGQTTSSTAGSAPTSVTNMSKSEFKNAEQQSDPEKAGPETTSDQRQPATNEPENKDKNDKDKKSDAQKRDPNSIGKDGQSGPSMIKPDDLNVANSDTLLPAPPTPPVISPSINPTGPLQNSIINDAITGRRRININIGTPY